MSNCSSKITVKTIPHTHTVSQITDFNSGVNNVLNSSVLNSNSANWLPILSANALFVNITGDTMTGGLSAPSLSTDNLFVGASTIHFVQNNVVIETLKSSDVSNFKALHTNINTNSGNWLTTYSLLNSTSAYNITGVNIYDQYTTGSLDDMSTAGQFQQFFNIAISNNGQYQLVGEQGGSYRPFYSNDYGATWQEQTLITGGSQFYGVAMSSSGQYQLANCYGVDAYISSDFGASWSTIPALNAVNVFLCSISDTGEYMTVFLDDGSYFISSNYGVSWTPVGTVGGYGYGIDMSSSGQYQIYGLEWGNIMVSNDYGNTWNSKGDTSGWADCAVSSDGSIMYVCANYGGDIYISLDYGETWNITAGSLSINWSGITCSEDGSKIFACDRGGLLYYSEDYGVSFVSHNFPQNWYSVAMTPDAQYFVAVFAQGDIYNAQIITNNIRYRPTITGDLHITHDLSANNNLYVDGNISLGGNIAIDGYVLNNIFISNVSATYVAVDANSANWSSAFSTVNSWTDDINYVESTSAYSLTGLQNYDLIGYDWNQFGANWSASHTLTGATEHYMLFGISFNGQYQLIQIRTGFDYALHLSDDYGYSFVKVFDMPSQASKLLISESGQYQVAISSPSVYMSSDYGVTWGIVYTGAASSYWPKSGYGAMSKSGQIILLQLLGAHDPQARISSDYGATWSDVAALGYGTSGGGIAMSDNAQYITMGGDYAGLFVSTDYGVSYSNKVSLVFPYVVRDISMSSDGKYQTATTSRLNDKILVSDDYGQTWNERGTASTGSITYDKVRVSETGQYQYVSNTQYRIFISIDFGVTWTADTVNTLFSTWLMNMSYDAHYILQAVSGSLKDIYTSRIPDVLVYHPTLSGRLTITDYLSSNTLISSFVNTNDISVTGNITISGDLFSSSNIYATSFSAIDGLNSSYWDDNYTTVNTNSAIWSTVSESITGINTYGFSVVPANIGDLWNVADLPLINNPVCATSSDGRYILVGSNNTGDVFISSNYGDTFDSLSVSYLTVQGIAVSSTGQYQAIVGGSGIQPEEIMISSDYGANWTAKDSNRIWTGVAMSSTGQYQTATVESGRIYISSDYGNTWTAKDSNRIWTGVAMSSTGQYQSATVQSGRIYISSDYGNTWTAKDSNRNWTGVAVSSTGQYQTALDAGGSIYISSDYGITWAAKASSLVWVRCAISSTGQYQTAIVDAGQIYISSDYGNIWTAKDSNRNWYRICMSDNAARQYAFVTGGTYNFYRSVAETTVYNPTISGNLTITNTLSANTLIVNTQTPLSSNGLGNAGTITWDSNYLYVCTASNTWKRVSITTW